MAAAAAVELEGDGVIDDSQNSHVHLHDDPPTANRVTGPKRRSTVGGWTPDLDKLLIEAYDKCQKKPWKKIAEMVPGKTDVQCLHRYQKVLNPSVHKGPWTAKEDKHLCELVKKLGDKKWSEIAKDLPGRIGKQCRERWNNHLKPSINTSRWTEEEDSIIMSAHREYGNKWAEISKLLPGRTENSIKNRWNCSLKKKVLQQDTLQKLDEQLNGVKNALSLSFGTRKEMAMNVCATEPSKDQNKSPSSDLIQQNKEQTRASLDKLKKDSNIWSVSTLSRLRPICTDGYFQSSLMSESEPASQEPKELDVSVRSMADNCSSPEASSLGSPASEIQFPISCSASPEAILRSRATTFKCIPSIIRKRPVEASSETTPYNKILKLCQSLRRLEYHQFFESHYEPVSLDLSLSLPSRS